MQPPSAWGAFVAALERAARSAATVLLVGESGAGKTRAARRLHAASGRADGPFVPVHLAGLSTTLIDAELFGHEEGAFTGAIGARAGRFVRADGGTIVLEGIETLPSDLQVKLLRVLQERVVEPLGAQAPVPVDVRVVATSAVDLRAEVDAGRFREDLYYRLAVVTLRVPALRERSDDVPALALELATEVAGRLGVPPRPLSDDARERLVAHPWPGNVRELENALERVHVLGLEGAAEPDGGSATGPAPIESDEFDFLDDGLRGAAAELAREALARGVGAEELTEALLTAALEEERGNASAAARRVGLTRKAFEYRRSRGPR